MNARFGFAVLVFGGLLVGSAAVARACDRFQASAVFAVPQSLAVFSAVPFGFGAQAVVVQGNCFVPGAVAVQSFGVRSFGVRSFGVRSFGGASAAASTGFGGASAAAAGGGRYRRSRAVSSSGGFFGFGFLGRNRARAVTKQ